MRSLTAFRYVTQLPGQLHVLIDVTPWAYITIWIPMKREAELVILNFLQRWGNTCLFYQNVHVYLQKLWFPSPSSNASDLQALFSLRFRTGLSHGRQLKPLLETDFVPL